MSDLIGQTLGHYRIVEKIGEGGMGEVYRAYDERLDRDVAVKVLPESVAHDKERLARFEREGKLLASLSHQNIATLHGLEEHQGQRCLVMELAKGETLAGVLARGAIPVEDALPIALQITEALEAAHEHGVVHRDLKPANVMVTAEGKVKVLDFGLAKAFDPEGSSPQSADSIAESPTITAEMTRAGTLLGTAAYMSPEQARGKVMDKRADVWAFGCVLYEMLVGTRAFPGTTSTEVLAGIIKGEPDWNLLPAETPNSVRRLLRRCLTKDPRDRLHDVADARIELQSIAADGFVGDEAASSPIPSRSRTWLPWGMVAVLSAVIIALVVGSYRAVPPAPVTKMLIGLDPAERLGSIWTTVTFRLSRRALAFSPDGRRLVFNAWVEDQWMLFLRLLDEDQATPIPGTVGAAVPFFSPDGNWIGFWADGMLNKVLLDGSPPTPVCEVADVPYSATWGNHGRIFYDQAGAGLYQVSSTGEGAPELITALAADEVSHRHPQILDDGDSLLYTVVGVGGSGETKIVAQSLTTGEKRTLVDNGADPFVTASGHLVYSRLGTLMAAGFNEELLELGGETIVALESLRQGVNAGNSTYETYTSQFSVSESGSLAYLPGGVWPDRERHLVWVDRGGNEEFLTTDPAAYGPPDISPDGSRFTYHTYGFEDAGLWIYEILRGSRTRMMSEKTSFPLWTPDGKWITVGSGTSGAAGIHRMAADGSGSLELLTPERAVPVSWSPDGKILVYVKDDVKGRNEIWALPLGGQPTQLIETPDLKWGPTLSPDGRWLAYASNQSGQVEIVATPFPGPGPRVQISTQGGICPSWAPDGRSVFFWGPRDADGMRPMIEVAITMDGTIRPGKPRQLFKGEYETFTPARCYDVAPDGQRFLMASRGQRQLEPVTHINVTLNWFEELNRLAPTD